MAVVVGLLFLPTGTMHSITYLGSGSNTAVIRV